MARAQNLDKYLYNIIIKTTADTERYAEDYRAAMQAICADDLEDGEKTHVSWTDREGNSITAEFERVPEGTYDSLTISEGEEGFGIAGKLIVNTVDRNGAPRSEEYTIARDYLEKSYSMAFRERSAFDVRDLSNSTRIAIRNAIKAVEKSGKPVSVSFKEKTGAVAVFTVSPDCKDGFDDGNPKVDFHIKEGSRPEKRLTQEEAMRVMDKCMNAKTAAEAVMDLSKKADALMKDPAVRIAREAISTAHKEAKKSLTVSVGNR